MKRILIALCLTAAAAQASTNTNLVAYARTLMLATNGLILAPSNFAEVNGLSYSTNDAALQAQITTNLLAFTTYTGATAGVIATNLLAFTAYTGATAGVLSGLATNIVALSNQVYSLSTNVGGGYVTYLDLANLKKLLQSQATNQTVSFSNSIAGAIATASNADALADAAYTLADGAVRRSGDTMTGALTTTVFFAETIDASNSPWWRWSQLVPENSWTNPKPTISFSTDGHMYVHFNHVAYFDTGTNGSSWADFTPPFNVILY